MKHHIILSIISTFTLALALSSCSDSKSYAELLTEENQCVNAFLAEHRVEETWPGAENCEFGENAPYYRVDEEGDVYMQVIAKGDGIYPEENDRVYFRYLSYDLNYYVVGAGEDNIGTGNMNNTGNTEPTYFLFDNFTIDQSAQYGTGIQIPVKLLGYNCHVNVVIKSQAGPSAYMSYVVPYLYDISYFPVKM